MQSIRLPDGDRIPVLGLGTWRVGGGMSADRTQDEHFIEMLRVALELGYTHIDTAESYGGGHTEELIGTAIQPDDREELFLTTKVSPSHLRYEAVLRSLDGSLNRLQTDYVDLYLIHWPSDRVPMEDTFRALNEAVADGRVRHLGVSNFNLQEMEKAQALSETPLATNQVPYNVLNRRYEHNNVLRYCQEHDLVLTAYSPVKGGVLGNEVVREIAEAHGATPAQVALRWLVRQESVITIPKSTDRQHLKDNLAALDLELTEEDVARLDRLR